MLYGLLAFISLVVAVLGFYKYTSGGGVTWAIVVSIIGVIGTVGFGGVFLSSRVNKKEDIHITE